MHDVACERPAQDAAVVSNGVDGDDDEGMFGQALGDGRQIAAPDALGQHRRFGKGPVCQDVWVDLRRRAARAMNGLYDVSPFGLFDVAGIGSQAGDKEQKEYEGV